MDSDQHHMKALLLQWQQTRKLRLPMLPTGAHNRITDVAGIKVGHLTLDDSAIQTGITAVIPGDASIYRNPLPCGVSVLNGFAKPAGLTQIEELGVLETPILLSNTLAVGRLFTGLARYMITHHPEIGRTLPTVNPLVLECNDGFLNDIQAMTITESMVQQALDLAATDFLRGSVGAGRGMSCFALKGGIGTSSRRIDTLDCTLGVLVLANFGSLSAFRLDGVPVGAQIAPLLPELAPQIDAGSIIILMATDAPLDARQLRRVAARAGAGLGRLGSYWGHGSGDISIAFTTQQHPGNMADSALEPMLNAAAEATEYAVLDAMLQATPVTGFQGHHRPSLSQILDRLAQQVDSFYPVTAF